MKKLFLVLALAGLTAASGCSAGLLVSSPSGSYLSVPPPSMASPSMTVPPSSSLSPVQAGYDQNSTYLFDVTLDWAPEEYERRYGVDYHYFSRPIDSPNAYTYQCEREDMVIDEIADHLGAIMMEDMMEDYGGKAFVITEYQNLSAHVLSEDEVYQWRERFGLDVTLTEDQWLCAFDADFRYTGIFSNIGEMPEEEWMTGLNGDGSEEDKYFIIQVTGELEYMMRAMPKTVLVPVG